ncbi:alpha/beta hydrolase [Prosthecobacter debontii]|nr:alpha/beta hydrolase [Prosthecobacter debontii]
MKWSLALAFTLSLSAAEPLTLTLWPDGPPGQAAPISKTTEEFIQKKAGKSTVTNITSPTITVYRPEKPNGTCVIVAPGGGYAFLSAVHEGSQVCEWLNTLGVTGVLLNYRTPTRDDAAPHARPVQDAQKTLEIVRQHSAEWNLNPKRVGVLGFSAGGNLLAYLACDQTGAQRPDFGVMIYGGGFLDPQDPSRFKEGFSVPSDAPPLFLVCAGDDGLNPIAATQLYLEYKKKKLSAEIHLFSAGGHGFGMRDNKQPINQWPQRCAEWMDSMGWLPTIKKLDAAIEREEQSLQVIHQTIQRMGCGNDAEEAANELLRIEGQLANSTSLETVAKANLDQRRVELLKILSALQKKLKSMPVTPEAMVTTINQTKARIAQLQDEREKLATALRKQAIK